MTVGYPPRQEVGEDARLELVFYRSSRSDRIDAGMLAVVSVNSRRKTARLKEHFGAEYERTVDDAGDQRAAEQELIARERKRQKLDVVELSPDAHKRFAQQWHVVQRVFVDDPSGR